MNYYGIKLTKRAIFMGGLLICSTVETVRNYRKSRKICKLMNTKAEDEKEIQRLTEDIEANFKELERLQAMKAEREINDIEKRIEEIKKKFEEMENRNK